MGGSRWIVVMLVMCLAPVVSHARTAAPQESAVRVTAGAGGSRALVTPLLWVLGALGVPVEDPSPLPNSDALERAQGWRTLEFPVRDAGLGAYIEVRGRIEFESAEVRFADGETLGIPLRGAVRGKGLYLLADFGHPRDVNAVIVIARARDAEARVGVRLGR